MKLTFLIKFGLECFKLFKPKTSNVFIRSTKSYNKKKNSKAEFNEKTKVIFYKIFLNNSYILLINIDKI